MSRVSLTELQSALGLKIPAALTLQSSPSSPTTGPHAKATPAANSKQVNHVETGEDSSSHPQGPSSSPLQKEMRLLYQQ